MKILVFPKSDNPYHTLLYGAIQKAHPSDVVTHLPASPRNLVFFIPAILIKRLQGHKVFHLHWHVFYLDAKYKVSGYRFISLANTLLNLTVIKLLGYKLVWTVHNVLPHETKTSNDKLVTRYTVKLASKVIVHSSETLDELADIGIKTDKTVINPHGNYDGAYPVGMGRELARKQLGVKPDETVVLFFGNIRPYKGLEDLLPVFSRMDDPKLRLVIAGRCLDEDLGRLIEGHAARDARIIYRPGNVPDDQVGDYYQAADMACIPYQSITTSGTAILAATFSLPLVAPRIGALRDFPVEAGALYDPKQPEALANALNRVVADPAARAAMSKAARAYADSLAWDIIAARTYEQAYQA